MVGFWESGDGFGEGYEVGVSIRPDGYARVLPLIPFNAMVVGTLKRTYHYTRVRYLGLSSNTTELWFKCLAYNLRRAGQLAGTTP